MKTPIGIFMLIVTAGSAVVLDLVAVIMWVAGVFDPNLYWTLTCLWASAAVVIVIDAVIGSLMQDAVHWASDPKMLPDTDEAIVCPSCGGRCGFVLECIVFAYFVPCPVCSGKGAVEADQMDP